MFQGIFTALVTPFTEGGQVDFDRLNKFVAWQIENGIDGFVPMGTTGESATVSESDHLRVVAEVTRQAKAAGRGVIAGAGSNSTAHTIELAQKCEKIGVDALLLVTPYYLKPSQEGLYQHFKAVHDATETPIILYNIPGRSIVDLSTETVKRLSLLPRIVGIKDATGDLARPVELRQACGADFCQLSGDDGTIGGYFAQGGHGVISVLSNIVPQQLSAFYRAWQEGDLKTFARYRDDLFKLSKLLFAEPSPAPAKACLADMGLMLENLHLPLVPISDKLREQLRRELMNLKVLDANGAKEKR